MYLVSLFGFSFAILSMAEMSSMYVAMYGALFCITLTDNLQGSYIRRTISVSDITYRITAGSRKIVSCDDIVYGACQHV